MNKVIIRQDWVDTQAIKALKAVILDLVNRPIGAPALAQFYGGTGMGKTTAAQAARVREPKGKIVIARAQQVWASSIKNVLTGLLYAMDEPAPQSNNATALHKRLVDALNARECVLIIDEADYLCGNPKLINALRDVHDSVVGNQPMVLIGEEGLPKKFEDTARMRNRFLVRRACPKITAVEAMQVIGGEGAPIAIEVLDRLVVHHTYSVRSLIGAVQEIRSWAAEQGVEDITPQHWNKMPKGNTAIYRAECA